MRKQIFKRFLVITKWFLLSLLAVLFLLFLGLNIPATQRFFGKQISDYLSYKTQKEIKIEQIGLNIWTEVTLQNVFIPDNQNDTLFSFEYLAIDLDVWDIFQNKIHLEELVIENGQFTIHKHKIDSSFSFSYLIDAFSSPPKDTIISSDTSSSGFVFELDKIQIINLKGVFVDEVSTMCFEGKIGSFSSVLRLLDLSKEVLVIESIQLANTEWYFDPGNSVVEDTQSEPTNWLINIGLIQVQNTSGKFIDKTSGIALTPELSFLQVNNLELDTEKSGISIDEFVFKDNAITYKTLAQIPKVIEKEETVESKEWSFQTKHILLERNKINFSDAVNQGSISKQQIDFLHFGLNNLCLDISNLAASPKSTSASVNHFELEVDKLLKVKSFKGDFYLDSKSLLLSNHKLKTAFSSLDYNLKVEFPSIETLLEKPQEVKIDLSALYGHLDRRDLTSFVDVLQLPQSIDNVRFDVVVKGSLDDLNISKFKIESENNIVLGIEGAVGGLPIVDSLRYDLKINELKTNLAEIRDLAQSQLSTDVNLPHWIDLQGTLKGTATTNETHLNMDSEMGKATVDANVDFSPNHEKYSVAITTKDLAVGQLTGSPELIGEMTASLKIEGQYFDPNKLVAGLDLSIESIILNNHLYNNTNITAHWSDKNFDSKINVQDTSLGLVINTKGKWQNQSLVTSSDIQVENINFKDLNISENNISLKTAMSLETQGLSLNDLNLKLNIKKGVVKDNEDRYNFSASTLLADFKENSSMIKLNSPVLLFDFESQFHIAELPNILEQHLSHYFEFYESGTTLLPDKKFDVSLKVLNDDLFDDILIPELHELDMNMIQLDYHSEAQSLSMKVDLPHVAYQDMILDSVQVDFQSNAHEFWGDILIGQFSKNEMTFVKPTVKFQIANDRLDLAMTVCDNQLKPKFGLKGDLQKVEDNYTWHISEEDGLMLYYNQWQAAKDNQILINPDYGLEFNNCTLVHENQSIQVSKKNAELILDIKDFTIQNITSIFYPENETINGQVNGRVFIDLNHKDVRFHSGLGIKDFVYLQDTIGDIDLAIQHQTSSDYQAQLKISGANSLQGSVNYKSNSGIINGEFDLIQFDLSTLSKHTQDFIHSLTGTAKGHVEFAGTTAKPHFKGKLNVNNAAFHVVATNQSYQMKRFDMVFNNDKIILEDVILQDIKGNKAVANGFVTLDQLFPDQLNFDVKMDKFPLLNTTEQKGELFYGNLAVSSTLKIRGTMKLPVIDAKLKLIPGSELTIVIPESEVSTEEYAEIVEFVDFNKPKEKDTIQISADDNAVHDLQINAFFEVTPDVKIKVIVDPVAGDYMEIKGNANLNFTLLPDGQMKLVGVYTVKEGHYQMSYHNVIKRKFNIRDGSSLSWSGDPFDPHVNIAALYVTKTSVLPLVQAQVANSELNLYKKSIPVHVVLNISDHMISPKLNFDIEIPNYNKTSSSVVSTRLNKLRQSDSEMNKQAFSLLVLNRFIPETSSQNSSSGSLQSSARGSVSQMVSDQFNSLAGNYIKSVNLNFNLDSYTDYSSGEAKGRTDLEVELSKTLFNDRMVVTVGSDFNVEGNSNTNTNNDDLNNLVGNVKAVYSIDENGHYLIKVYRQNEYAGVIDGNITKTGLSFVFSKEFKTLLDKQIAKEAESSETKPKGN